MAAAKADSAAKQSLDGSAETAKAAAPAGNTAAAPSGQASSGFTGLAAEGSDAITRKIMYKANLTMQVEAYVEAQAKIQEAVQLSGGYVLQFSENMSSTEKGGTFVIKVPATGFTSLLTKLEQIQPTMQKNIQGQDVTEEFVDLTARLKAKQVVESRLIAFMEKATKTDELVQFSNELGKVQEEIERIKGRMRYLEQNVAFSTIELRVYQKIGSAEVIQAKDRGPLFQRAAAAINGTSAVLSVVFQWIVVIVAGALPILILAAVLFVPLWLLRKRRKRKLDEIRKQLASEDTAAGAQEPHND